jgi:hypothetical protein
MLIPDGAVQATWHEFRLRDQVQPPPPRLSRTCLSRRRVARILPVGREGCRDPAHHPLGAILSAHIASLTGKEPAFEMCPGLLETRLCGFGHSRLRLRTRFADRVPWTERVRTHRQHCPMCGDLRPYGGGYVALTRRPRSSREKPYRQVVMWCDANRGLDHSARRNGDGR